MPAATHVQGNGGAAFAGNLLVGGLVGMGVDAATGAAYDHTPNPVVLALEPEAPAPAVGPVRERKRGAHPKVAAVDGAPKS